MGVKLDFLALKELECRSLEDRKPRRIFRIKIEETTENKGKIWTERGPRTGIKKIRN
jgi:hypothetical protein